MQIRKTFDLTALHVDQNKILYLNHSPFDPSKTEIQKFTSEHADNVFSPERLYKRKQHSHLFWHLHKHKSCLNQFSIGEFKSPNLIHNPLS
jgi:hypothetical protein